MMCPVRRNRAPACQRSHVQLQPLSRRLWGDGTLRPFSMPSVERWKHQARDWLSVRALLLPALIVYGFLVDPLTGQGGIPCMWKLCFGVECPGCGLSRADALLVHGFPRAAVARNWLIVPLWLAGIKSFALQMSTTIKKGVARG